MSVTKDFSLLPAYVINLRRRPERLEGFWQRWDLAEIVNSLQVFQAHDGKDLELPAGWKHNHGVFGCSLSHQSLWLECIRRGEPVWVLEDDCSFSDDFWDRATSLYRSLPEDWEAFYLGGRHMQTPTTEKPGLVRCADTEALHSYIIRPNFARKALAQAYFYDTHIDHIAERVQRSLPVYAMEPFVCGQIESWSETRGELVEISLK